MAGIGAGVGNAVLIVKPRCDGCSAGIVFCNRLKILNSYCHFMDQKDPFIPPFLLLINRAHRNAFFLIRRIFWNPYIETDSIRIERNRIKYIPKEGWIELTVGVLEDNRIYHAMNPSITVAEGAILAWKRNFKGGTGINLTPPPADILSSSATEKIKGLVEKTAHALGIQNYARLDIFFNRLTEK